MSQIHNPTHPGEILLDIWPKGLTLTAAANQLGVHRSVLANIMNGELNISADMADKLHNWGGITADEWLRLQASHDGYIAKRNARTNEDNFQIAA